MKLLQASSALGRFRFGENWRSFIQSVDSRSIQAAQAGLVRLIPAEVIKGREFFDIGCGSGLSMLAALRLGASFVTGIDYDPDSVEASMALLRKHAPGENWSVLRKSVFDLTLDAGVYDNVYSWGVLHHTGNLWRALQCAAAIVKPAGHFAFALYRKTPLCGFWAWEKRLYAGASPLSQAAVRQIFIALYRAALLTQLRNPLRYEREYRQQRGMDWKHDVHDWLGGYPYQSVEPAAIKAELTRLGFTMKQIIEHDAPAAGLFGSHCDEFTAVKRISAGTHPAQPASNK